MRSAALAFVAGDGVGGDLDEHAAAQPVLEARGIVLQGGVALGVGEDRREAGELEVVEGLGEAGGKAVVGDLDEQVAEAVDAEARGVGLGLLHIVEGEMEVAAAAEGEGDAFAWRDGCEARRSSRR